MPLLTLEMLGQTMATTQRLWDFGREIRMNYSLMKVFIVFGQEMSLILWPQESYPLQILTAITQFTWVNLPTTPIGSVYSKTMQQLLITRSNMQIKILIGRPRSILEPQEVSEISTSFSARKMASKT